MKKLTLTLFTLLMSFSVFAGEITGKILNLRSDEEGMKVIVQATEGVSVAYLSNQSTDFLATVKTLKDAQMAETKVKIITKDNELAEVIRVELLK